jgi:hypothetical protein
VGVKATVVEVLILDGLGEGGFEEEDPPLHEPNPQGWGTRPPRKKTKSKSLREAWLCHPALLLGLPDNRELSDFHVREQKLVGLRRFIRGLVHILNELPFVVAECQYSVI